LRSLGPKLLPVLAIALALPFIYTSCQQFKGIAGSTAITTAATCKYMIEKGERIAVLNPSTPEVFKNSKVILSDPNLVVAGHARAQNPAVPNGAKLSVMIDNNCYRGLTAPSSFIISLMGGVQPHPMLNQQAYQFTVPNSTSQAELEALAAQESCVVGMSWENEYKPADISFNDTGRLSQPYLGAINAFDADNLFYATNGGLPVSGGTKVKIAVLDTGAQTDHPDLAGNLWQTVYGPGIDITTIGGTMSWNPLDVSSEGHGTNVAGIIGAVSNNAMGIVGTMPFNAELMILKVFSGSGTNLVLTTTSLLNGLEIAYLNGAKVINLSIESTGSTYDAVASAGLTAAVNNGATVAVAMGNNSPGLLVDGTTVHEVPAVYSTIAGVIGVASFDSSTGALSSFSNYSTTYAEIAAPGAVSESAGIYSTIPGSTYGTLMGTSQATPMVSAAAGLTSAWITQAYGTAPSPAEVERLILLGAKKSTLLAPYVEDGNQLDLLGLAQTIQSQYPKVLNALTGTTPATPTPSPVISTTGSTLCD
jgi:hypothetical protein